MKKTRHALWMSVLSLMLCASMLIGTSYAWFTDSVTSGNNRILSGKLDVEMYWAEDCNGPWYNVEDPQYNTIFNYDKWEPGYTELRYIKVVNAGNLALKYRLSIEAASEVGAIADVIDAYFVADPGEIADRTDFSHIDSAGTLGDLIRGLESGVVVAPEWPLLPEGADPDDGPVGEEVFAVALHMQETAGNEYQGASIGDGFYLTLRAAQLAYEEDSFGSDYDEDAAFPVLRLPALASAAVATDESGVVTDEVVISTISAVSAVIPSGTELESGADSVTLSVSLVSQEGNIYGGDNLISRTLDVHVSNVAETNTQPIIITIPNALPVNLQPAAVTLYHKEGGVQNEMTRRASASEVVGHNDYYYNSVDGSVTMALASFSEILVEASLEDKYTGAGMGRKDSHALGYDESKYYSEYGYPDADTSWYTEGKDVYTINSAAQLEGLAKLVYEGNEFEGKTIKLGKDIIINDWKVGDDEHTAIELSENNDPAFDNNGVAYKYFPAIGSYDYGNYRPFCGTFDGQGHTVSGLFNLYYDDPMEKRNIGLFGMVEGATIKDLTISDCFYYTYGGMIGMVAARAFGTCNFENITVKDNFATQYNYYLGGIVGYAYSGNAANGDKPAYPTVINLTNCYVDNTNKFEALWGTYDAAIGGLVGAVGAKNFDTAPTVNITNCTVFPEVSLYNDCCANYQWFAYRYSGMLVGYVNASDRAQYLGQKVVCTDTTVKYGLWTDMYYCEFVRNGHPSYCEPHDWKYSRVDKSELTFNKTTKKYECSHDHSTAGGRIGQKFNFKGVDYDYDQTDENNACVNIKFDQLFGGGQGVYGETNETYLTYCEKYGKNSTGVTIEDNGESGANLSTKFVNKDKYLYRIGNKNSVTIGTIFSADGITDDESVQLITETVSGTASVTYTPNSSNWENGTLQFTGMGLVKLTFKYLGSTPVELYLEVIDAKNISAIANISDSDAVLVKDCSMGETTYTISKGHTLYGNGFTVSSTNVGLGLNAGNMGAGYIELDNGNLENVRVVCAIYPRGYLYASSTSYGEAVQDSNNKNPLRSESGKDRYNYQYSAVAITGKSSISNCYIEGARNNILFRTGASGSIVYNTTLAYGSLANIHVNMNSGTITFKDLSTIQDVVSTNLPSAVLCDGNHDNDGSKTVYGLGILVGDNETSSYPTIKLEGTLKQNNWIKQGTTVSSSVSNTIINAVFNGNADYQKTINGQKYVNVGIVYMSTKSANINSDNMTNKADYKLSNVSIGSIGTGQTYSYIGSADSSSLIVTGYGYSANEKDSRSDAVKLNYTGSYDYAVSEEYDSATNRLIPTVRAEIGEGESAAIAVKDIVAVRSGRTYRATGFTVNGEAVSSDYLINCSKSNQFTIGLSGTTTGYYDKNGVFIDDVRSFDLAFKFLVVSTAIDPPQLIFNSNYDTYNNKYRSTNSGDWTGVWKALNDAEVRYYSLSRNCYVQVPLSVFTPASNGKLNNGNSTWTGTYDGCTLTITSTAAIHSGKKDYGYFIVYNGEMYLTNSNKVSTSSTSRGATIKYEFVDGNSKTVTVSKARTIDRANTTTYLSPSTSSSQYILRLDPGAGTVSPNAYGPNSKNASITLPTPTLDGYAFDGWYDQPVGGSKQSNSYKTSASNVVLFAHWIELVNYTITLDSNGGYCDETEIEGYSGESCELPPSTKDGYWFVGWYDVDERVGGAGVSYTIPDRNLTLTAHWSPKYTVTYNANGGTVSPASETYAGTALTLPTPTPGTKPTFEGWFTAASGGTRVGGSGDPYVPTANITLYAQWSTNIPVTFDANSGSCNTSSATSDGVAAITLPTATWAGHQFNGWYTAASGGTQVGNAGASYIPSAAITLYAQWTAYTVTYNANGGSVSTESATAGSNGSVTLPTPTRTGYTFNGWYTAASGGSSAGAAGANYEPNSNITLYAQWQQQTFTVTIKAGSNGSVNPTSIANVPYGTTVTVSSNTLTINGTKVTATANSNYEFDKWDISNGATITSAKTITASFKSTSSGGTCVTEGTLITLADGTQKPVEELTGEELLLVWNLETGSYDVAPIMFIDSDPETEYTVIHTCFSDGTDVEVVSEHGFFDLDLGEYVYISEDTLTDYIGDRFVKLGDVGSDSWEVVTLTDVWTETRSVKVYSPVTFGQLCYYTEGMLSMPGGISGLFNIFEVDTDRMVYDEAKMEADIAAYGLLTLDDFGGLVNDIAFEAFNGRWLGIAVAKGNLTWEYIAYLAERYGVFW